MHEQVRRSSNKTNLSQPSTTSYGPSTFFVQRKAKKANKPQSNGSYSTPTALAQRREATVHSPESQTVLNHNVNETGLPEHLKVGGEILTGKTMRDVVVERNSSDPARVDALGTTQRIGKNIVIKLASGQEEHLNHEFGHVVQQMREQVKPTMEVNGIPINNDQKLEREATEIGERAAAIGAAAVKNVNHQPVQRLHQTGSAVQAKFSIVQRAPSPSPQTPVTAPQGFDSQAPTVPEPSILDKHKQKCITIGPSKDFLKLNPDGSVSNKRIVSEQPHQVTVGEYSNGEKNGYVFTLGDSWYWIAKADAQQVVAEAGFKKENQPLFPTDPTTGQPKMPSVEDVKQGYVGDCYLLAAIASIAKANPQYILEMFKDYGDTVSVRLYDVDRWDFEDVDESDPKFTPRWIKVNKSVAKNVNGDWLYARDSLWVNMLEKAYAAGGFGGGFEDTNDKNVPPSYQKIDDGYSEYALCVIIGKATSVQDLEDVQSNEFPWSFGVVEEYNDYPKAQSSKDYTKLLAYKIFSQNEDKLHQWMDWLTNHQTAIDNLYKQKTSGYKDYTEEFRLEDFETLFKTEGLDETLIDDLMPHLEKYLPGKRGTGKYTEQQLATYNLIEKKLSNNEPVISYTMEVTGRPDKQDSKGLKGKHEYTVTGCKHDSESGLRYVKLYDPHGEGGREYDWKASKGNKAKEKIQGDGNFDLELSDLMKRFRFWVTT